MQTRKYHRVEQKKGQQVSLCLLPDLFLYSAAVVA